MRTRRTKRTLSDTVRTDCPPPLYKDERTKCPPVYLGELLRSNLRAFTLKFQSINNVTGVETLQGELLGFSECHKVSGQSVRLCKFKKERKNQRKKENREILS